MKTLIISDAHFSVENVKLALSANPETQFLLFLGDGCKEMTRLMDFYPRVAFIAVKGNCDLFENDYPVSRTAIIDLPSPLLPISIVPSSFIRFPPS